MNTIHTTMAETDSYSSVSDEDSIELYGNEGGVSKSVDGHLKETKPDISDGGTFSFLMSQIETHQREIKRLRKQINPIRKRLRSKMEDEQLDSLECGSFVISMESEEDEESVVYSKAKLTEFFTEEQIQAYENDPASKRAPRKKRRLKCERLLIDVDNTNE